MKNICSRLNKKGFTLVEALIAISVLVVGILGIQAAMRRGLVNSVGAWDRELKTSIAMSRLEEHKAQIFSNYQPGMVLPVMLPQPGNNFSSGSITYVSNVRVSIDAVSNTIFAQSGYGVIFPTPGHDAAYYYGDVNPNASPTPNFAWGDYKRATPCDKTQGNISFVITTPKNVRGLLTLSTVDFKGLSRGEKLIMGGSITILAEGSISSSTPTPITFPITNLDTSDGLLNITVQQTGSANDWGFLIEDGTSNSSGMSISAPPDSPFTPTPTSAVCPLNVCSLINADSFGVVSPFTKVGSVPPKYIQPSSSGGSASATFDLSPCVGVYKAQVVERSCSSGSCTSRYLRVVLTNSGGAAQSFIAAGVTINGTTPVTWYDNTSFTSFQTMDITHGNGQPDPTVNWLISTTGTYTLTFNYGPSSSNLWPRIQDVCFVRIGDTPTPLPSGPTPTPTVTNTPFFNFPSNPVPLNKDYFGDFVGTPGYQQYGCDSNLNALTASGKTNADGIVNWKSNALSYTLNAAGNVYANVRLMPNMSVTMSIVKTPGPRATAVATASSGGSGGWYEVATTNSLASGTTITQVLLDFAGGSSAVTNYLAVDSARVVYDDNALNPNVVLTSASLAVLDTYRDTTTYKDFVVDSSVQPMTMTGNASGYQVEVVVHNGRNGVITDKFPPITIMNSVSP